MAMVAMVAVAASCDPVDAPPPGETPPSVPRALPGTPLWTGDFETGTLRQWRNGHGGAGVQVAAEDRIRVVTDPVRQGRYAARVEVRQGDRYRGSPGNRSELLHQSGESEGDERWYSWSTMFDPSFPYVDHGFQLVTTWHPRSSDGQATVTFYAARDEFGMRVVESDADRVAISSETLWVTQMSRGEWHDLALRVKWSADPRIGFVELWHEGELVLERTNVATLIPDGTSNYLKQGLYRSSDIQPVGVVYHDAMQITAINEDLPVGVPVPPPRTNSSQPPAPEAGDGNPGAA